MLMDISLKVRQFPYTGFRLLLSDFEAFKNVRQVKVKFSWHIFSGLT